ncbi:hypothetical protein DFH06DRAFT_1428837, partial [Mycena polygramma]
MATPSGSRIENPRAAVVQDFPPVKQNCGHLNAFHVYASDSHRFVETDHYRSHLIEGVRQCILYDGPGPSARLIGVEYMVSPKVYETLSAEEQRLWHRLIFEVKRGKLFMPGSKVPWPAGAQWEASDTGETEDTDRGDALPLGQPELMMSPTQEGDFDFDCQKQAGERDTQFELDPPMERQARERLEAPASHSDADSRQSPE